jgi:small subunit ribosomal protein S6
MPHYEHVYIVRQDITPQAVDQLTETLKGVVEQNGGSLVNHEYWGLRNLNYRIKKNRKGHYVLMNLDAPPAAVNELERQQKINEDIIRYLTVRVEAHTEGPSAMMKQRDRDRERDRERGFDRDRDDRGYGFEAS